MASRIPGTSRARTRKLLRPLLRGTLALVLVAGAASPSRSAARQTASPEKSRVPNVLVVLTDDQGYGDFGCHGNPVLKTPYLDQLHDQSIRFTDFHSTPMCTPTRGQLMTGRDALANGAYCVCSGRTFIHRGIPTMADVFAANGYRTAIFGKWHLGDNYPFRPNDRGFQEAVYHLGWGITSTSDYWNNDYFDDFFRHNGQVKQYPGYSTDVWFAEAARWIRERHEKGEPFFAYLAMNAPHGPFYVPAKYRKPYEHLDRDTSGFFGMIANLDENLARLDAMLAETGLRDNTILVFMTDNGGTGGINVYNAGMRGAKTSLYEGGHRVPCFIRWPAGGLRSPGDIADLAEVQDILPTLAELCTLRKSLPAHVDGISLAPLLKGQAQPQLDERLLVVQYGGLVQSQPAKWDSAVLWRKWRLVQGKELYDVAADPAEKRDVAAEHPDIVETLRRHYDRWWARIEPGLDRHETITLGADEAGPVTLTAMDWLVPKLTPSAQPFDIRLAGTTEVKEGSLPLGRPSPAMNGFWNVSVARDGEYTISLRRWPVEADTPIRAGLPAYQGVDGSFPEGKALPIARARLKIGGIDQTRAVGPTDKAAEFTVTLHGGPAHLETWFYDADGKEVCGALYVDVLRK